jgi:hypothetical protein
VLEVLPPEVVRAVVVVERVGAVVFTQKVKAALLIADRNQKPALAAAARRK